jgi:hypothetical protein
MLQTTIAFIELLSLGFATIGVGATLTVIAGQVFGIAPHSERPVAELGISIVQPVAYREQLAPWAALF